jgi:hypothetical protein
VRDTFLTLWSVAFATVRGWMPARSEEPARLPMKG